MHLPDHLYRRILSLYKAQGDLPLSPSFVAYELDIPTAEAEQCLDNLVRESVLVFDFDQDGEIYYRPGSAYRFEDEEDAEDAHLNPPPRPAPEADIWGSVQRAPDQRASNQRGSGHHTSNHISTGVGATDGFASATHQGARQNRSPRHFDGDTATATAFVSAATPKRRARATAGPREYIPPASARRSSRRSASRRPDSRRSDSQRRQREAPPREVWAEIGPNGYDGCVENATGQPAPRQYLRPRTPTPPEESPWSEHRRFAGLNPTTTELVAPSDTGLQVRTKRSSDPLLASFLSLVFVGGGQLYNGELAKGIGFVVTFIALWTFGLGWMVHIWAAVDAYQIASSRRELT